ncbi:hypothetical protein SNEBB_009460 [Seison nebaliae]|nr:hypothetical protein SNEBB_009460 [Seison nebaliae]
MKIKDISNIPDKEIDKLVGEIRQEHIEKSTSGLIRQQYQYLSCLPVARVAYQYNDNHYGSFYVMGSNRHVFSPTYPESCCCCCQCRYCYQCRCQIM